MVFVRQGQTQNTTIQREAIEVDAVPYYEMADEKTGYIVLSKFNAKATQQTKSALNDLKSKGAERIILDLRGNPGGLLSEAINVTNLFIPKGELVVTTKSKVKKFNREYFTRNQPEDSSIPLAVLINGSSASASEIVSGSLQDLDRAVIIGARSFGKGLVQRPLRLTYGTQLKVTISRYYTSSGRCIQALDYRNRDEQGNALRNTDFKEFTTRNGRKVQDGGGVLPDLEIETLKSNSLVKALQSNNTIFDYATKYYYSNQLNDVNDFNFDDTDFSQFKNFVSESNFTFVTKTEEALIESMSGKDKYLFDENVKQQYQTFLSEIERSKETALDSYQNSIQKSLEDEIVKRYFYREGLYDYYLKKDEAILTARGVLADQGKYTEILN